MNSTMTRPSTTTRDPHLVRQELGKVLISVLILALGGGAFWLLKSMAKPPATQDSLALIQQVETYDVQPYSGMLDMVISGSVVPHREINLAAEVAGRIKKKYDICDAGSYVLQGDQLLEIDDEEYQLDLRTVEAQVAEADKRIEENQQQIQGEVSSVVLAKADLVIQQKEHQRNKRLASVLSQSELDQTERALNAAKTMLSNRESALATLRAGTARLEAAKDLSLRQLDKAKLNLRRTMIVAPADGLIIREMAQEGDFVNKGTPMVVFEDTDSAEILCHLTTADLNWIRENSQADPADKDVHAVYRIPRTEIAIFDPAEPSVIWRGVLERFEGIGRDEITRTIPCRIVVAEPVVESKTGQRALVRGMFVKCRIEVQTTSNDRTSSLLSIPSVAIHPNSRVWAVNEDSQLYQVKIDVVDTSETNLSGHSKKISVIRVLEGSLSSGDKVVVTPLSQPTDGSSVIIKDEQ